MSDAGPATVIEAVASSLSAAGNYNRDDKVQPVAILWNDPGRGWESLVPMLQEIAPIAVLGEYSPDERTGPGIYLRCLLDGVLGPSRFDGLPIIYMPGVERSEIRAIEGCAPDLRALAELQFRAAWWQQANGSPWTPSAFLRSRQGLGLELGRDDATQEALKRALTSLANAPLEDLKRRERIDGPYLGALVNPDEVKLLLQWLDAPVAARDQLARYKWDALVAQVKSTLGVNLEADGELIIAEKLGMRDGDWKRVWARFAESPRSYPHIPELLRRARPDALFVGPTDSWPQENEAAEGALRVGLGQLSGQSVAVARARVVEMNKEHSSRRQSVWSSLGHAPLAAAVHCLAHLATLTETLPIAETDADFAAWYSEIGWKTDAEAISSLAAATGPSDRIAVAAAVRAIYLPWLDEVARRFQDVVTTSGYDPDIGLDVVDGDCVLFVDGLRYDVGERLRVELAVNAVSAEIAARLAPFPTVTSTGKPAVAPIGATLTGGDGMSATTAEGKTAGAEVLRALMRVSGVTPFPDEEVGEPSGRGWTEAADLDATGHKLGVKLVDHIPREVADLVARVNELLAAGWKRVVVVTDHGWLLMPGGFSKIELAQHLTEPRQRRCARLVSGALDVKQPVLPWSWNASVSMASPRGTGVFELGEDYLHGGLSPQECITPMLTVFSGSSQLRAGRIEQVKWIGMRCRVDVVGAPAGSALDLRRSPGDGTSTLLAETKTVDGDVEAKLLVENDELDGVDCFVVLLSAQGEILAQVSTRVRG